MADEPDPMPIKLLAAVACLPANQHPLPTEQHVWRLADFQALAGYDVTTLIEDRLYAVVLYEYPCIQFAILEWVCEDDDGPYVVSFWCGRGLTTYPDPPPGALRELRHSHFGSDFNGYFYYIDMRNFQPAIEFLSKYFDMH